jgi:hypothetical protein
MDQQRRGYHLHDGLWLDPWGRPAGRRTQRQLNREARRWPVRTIEGPEDPGGSAGVREPRRPLGPPPTLAAEVDLPA